MNDNMINSTNNKSSRYLQLFLSVLKLSACTFGGGFVIVPLMRKRFVDELGWLSEQEMLDMAAIAQSTPGAIAVNASILVGYHVAGIRGALLAVLGTITPPLVIISVISYFYQAFRDNALVSLLMAGLLCGVAAVVFDVVVDMVGSLLRQKRVLPFVVLAGSFVAVRFFSVNIILVIIICAFIGTLDTLYREKQCSSRDSASSDDKHHRAFRNGFSPFRGGLHRRGGAR